MPRDIGQHRIVDPGDQRHLPVQRYSKVPEDLGPATASGPADAVLVIRLRAHDI